MKAFGKFFLDATELPSGTIVMLMQESTFQRKALYAVTDGRAYFQIQDLQARGDEYKGTITDTLIDPGGMHPEILLKGLSLGEELKSYIQLYGLPIGAVLRCEASGLEYKKLTDQKWTGDQVGQRLDSVHFDPALKYIWIK